MLFDITELRWSDELCDLLGVPVAALPDVSPVERAGSDSRRDGAACAAGIPVAGIAGDQQAALFGQACFAAGHGEEHLRHGQLRADERRRSSARHRRTGC